MISRRRFMSGYEYFMNEWQFLGRALYITFHPFRDKFLERLYDFAASGVFASRYQHIRSVDDPTNQDRRCTDTGFVEHRHHAH